MCCLLYRSSLGVDFDLGVRLDRLAWWWAGGEAYYCNRQFAVDVFVFIFFICGGRQC